MSNQLTCKDPFGYKPGLEDGNSFGPSPVSNSNIIKWLSSNDGILRVSKTITIDSVFASYTLNQQGGNYSTSGYLYEIWLDGFVNNNNVQGNVLNGGKWIFFNNELNLMVYDLVVVDTQDVIDPTFGNITKILVADPTYSQDFSNYVNLIQQGDQYYFISTTPLLEHANSSPFDIQNDIVRSVNFNSKDISRIIDKPLLSYSSNGSLWIESPETVLSYPQLVEGNSLRLERRDNPESGFEVTINGTPTYRGQINDVSSENINLNTIKLGSKISMNLTQPYQFYYKKGDTVYVSNTLIDIKSGNYGIEYFKATVLSFENGTLNLMVTFKPAGASAAGTQWYVISEVDQINIPISSSYYISILDQSELLEYDLLSCVFSVRLQIQKNKRFNRYVFRYKPDNSSQWKYFETTEESTIIENILPNTIFFEEIMGFNDETGGYCGFSDQGTFNTFF
jgi:hypothetical protein